MKPIKIFSVLFLFWFIGMGSANAQQQAGQIVVNAGVGISPGFDGFFNGLSNGLSFFPIPSSIGDSVDGDGETLYTYRCATKIPNIGVTVDYGLSKIFSLGIASNYQSEIVYWPLESGTNLNNSDKISRTNLGLRFLFHFPFQRDTTHYDTYFGIRTGYSFWMDIPSSNNALLKSHPTFLVNPNAMVPSIQLLVGFHYYVFKNLGFTLEFGFGSPYLAEGGITFRINTHKEKTKTETTKPVGN